MAHQSNQPSTSKQPQITQEKQKDYLISQISESTNTKASEKQQPQLSDRYANSDFKPQMTNDDTQSMLSQQEHQQVPFYMNNPKSHLIDEDVEGFAKKLDTLILNFRSETMSEFMKTKKQVLQEQAQTIDAERRRCNTMIGVKQNEIEQLKESLGSKSKMCDELNIRCEGMAFWAGKSKTLLRMKVMQYKSFETLKQYWQFKKHSKKVLDHKVKAHKAMVKRQVFLQWEKQYKEWKVEKNKQDFEKALKQELQHIAAQYSKEIESLREKLNEAQQIVDQENRNKSMMQENLKKAFMRGVCALNFEAMNILNPNDIGYQNHIEKEMEKQLLNAMNGITSTPQTHPNVYSNASSTYDRSPQQQQIYQRSNVFQENLVEDHTTSIEKKLFQIGSQYDTNEYGNDYKKVESKDSLWKPAPIMGTQNLQQTNSFSTYQQQPQITSQLRQTSNYVLPSHFNQSFKPTTENVFEQQQQQITVQTNPQQLQSSQIQQQSQLNVFQHNMGLPEVVMKTNNDQTINSSLPMINQTQCEGKTIYASGQNNTTTTGGKTIVGKQTGAITGTKKTNTTTSVNNKKLNK